MPLFVFPEGARTPDGTMQPFYNKSGAELRAEFAARKAKEAATR